MSNLRDILFRLDSLNSSPVNESPQLDEVAPLFIPAAAAAARVVAPRIAAALAPKVAQQAGKEVAKQAAPQAGKEVAKQAAPQAGKEATPGALTDFGTVGAERAARLQQQMPQVFRQPPRDPAAAARARDRAAWERENQAQRADIKRMSEPKTSSSSAGPGPVTGTSLPPKEIPGKTELLKGKTPKVKPKDAGDATAGRIEPQLGTGKTTPSAPGGRIEPSLKLDTPIDPLELQSPTTPEQTPPSPAKELGKRAAKKAGKYAAIGAGLYGLSQLPWDKLTTSGGGPTFVGSTTSGERPSATGGSSQTSRDNNIIWTGDATPQASDTSDQTKTGGGEKPGTSSAQGVGSDTKSIGGPNWDYIIDKAGLKRYDESLLEEFEVFLNNITR